MKSGEGGKLGLDQYILPAVIFADTDIFAPTYWPPIPIQILSFWTTFRRYLVFWPIYADILANIHVFQSIFGQYRYN